MVEFQLRNREGQPLRDARVSRTIAVALRDAFAGLLGVQTVELGCEAREVRDGTGRIQSIFVFDHFAAGYSSNATRFLNELFHQAVRILNCPKNCDSCCPSCVLDFDQRFDAASLDRNAALAFLNPDWLNSLKVPKTLQFFGDSSQVEVSGLLEAVIRESGHSDAGRSLIYLNGSNWDFAASPARMLAYKLLSMSRPLGLVICNSSFATRPDVDSYSLAALAEHPNASVRTAEAPRVIGGATVIAEVERGGIVVAWASSDPSAIEPNQAWGKSEQPIIFGTSSPLEWPKECSPVSLRPAVINPGDLELSIQNQLTGTLNTFGTRFWSLLCSEHAATNSVLTAGSASVLKISYSDRYLFTPLSVALLNQVILGLRELLDERFGKPEIVVNTMEKRQELTRSFTPKVFSDWPSMKARNEVLVLVLSGLGKVTVTPSGAMQHSRQLRIDFSSGEVLNLRFDQGVSYWRVSSRPQTGSHSLWFDFGNLNLSAQADRIMSLNLQIEGQFAPTQIFAAVRRHINERTVSSQDATDA